MKKKLILLSTLIFAFLYGCQEDDQTFGDLVTPTNLEFTVSIADDQSGNVTIIPTAENALNFHIQFLEGNDPVVVTESGLAASFRYTEPGQYEQVVIITAFGTGGASVSRTTVLNLDVLVTIDPDILEMLTGSATEASSKEWRWDSSNPAHFGVGDPIEDFPNFFSASPFQLNECLYDDVLTFSNEGIGVYRYNLATNGSTFTNWAEVNRFFPNDSPQQFVDECRDLSNDLAVDEETSFLVVTDENTGVSTLTVDNSTLSYWSGATSYVITELTNTRMVVRGIQNTFLDPTVELAWYHTFVTEGGDDDGNDDDNDDNPDSACGTSGLTGQAGDGDFDFNTLVWSDEFNEDGAPCEESWRYDIGTGDNGWGNGESQYYTDRPENVIVEDGVLKITAIRENFNGSQYTSSRINTLDNFEFEYGRVVARAKLPTGGGTWPAIWTLGADFQTNPWPAAGEMDIMEHVGNSQDEIFSTVHFPGNSGGDGIGDSFIVEGVSEEFHIYEFIWTPAQIRFLVDGQLNFLLQNNDGLPFNKDFFLIMNVAMGGTFGGDIESSFQQSTMEVDYIRVYQ